MTTVTLLRQVPCKMYGFPGFDLIGPKSNGSTNYSPTWQTETPATVLLPPGSRAHALFTALPGPDVCNAGVGMDADQCQRDTVGRDQVEIGGMDRQISG
jgi:hypothetical protein